jgi:hypothetical protein
MTNKEAKPIILDDNPLSLSCYIEEYGDIFEDKETMNKKEDTRVELGYNLLETTKEKAGQIVQFLISYHELNEKDFDFSK